MADGASAAHGAAAGAEHSANFPPFDAALFQHQAVWLIVSFAALYGLLNFIILPKIGGAIAARKSSLEGDLAAASDANAAAKAASESYERSVQAAKLEARQLADAARAEAGQAQAQELAQADARLAERLSQAEHRLEAARATGLLSAQEAAKDAAQAILAKLLPRLSGGHA
jgi:F-type H+-transporting ATPase subunit b